MKTAYLRAVSILYYLNAQEQRFKVVDKSRD